MRQEGTVPWTGAISAAETPTACDPETETLVPLPIQLKLEVKQRVWPELLTLGCSAALPLTGCVALGKIHFLSVLQDPVCKMGITVTVTSYRVVVRIR